MAARYQNPLTEAEAILRRGTGVTRDHLVRLIHEVNPTSRDLGDAERERRYHLKAALQSLLIERFSDDITVEPTEEHGVVSLQHGCAGADACHAVIDELDDQARAFVRYRLDLQREHAAPRSELPKPRSTKRSNRPAETGTPTETDGLLRAGRVAAGEYDFERAERCFEDALSASLGDVAAASALLELWVDEMGADEQALGLEARLPKATVGDPEIRTWLAIAAARNRDLKRVDRLIRGLESPRLAEILALAAAGACVTLDASVAALWVAQLRSCDPMHPALAECENLLHRSRDDARVAEEAELGRLLQQGTLSQAEQFAQGLLTRWPESLVAARFLQQRRRERADLEAERALGLAEQELARGALREAIATLSGANATDLSDAKKAVLVGRITEIEQQQREQIAAQRQTDALTAMHEALRHGRTRLDDAVDRYLDLTSDLRANVRSQLGHSELGWIEPVLSRFGVRRARPLTMAVLALAEERMALELDPIAALERMARHAELLDQIPEAHKLLAAARQRARQVRSQRAIEQLQLAERSSVNRDWSATLALLEGIVVEHLPIQDRERQQRLLDAARNASQLDQLAQRVEQLQRSGDLFDALDALRELEQRSESTERASWSARREALRSEVAQSLHAESGDATLGDFWFPALKSEVLDAAPAPWVAPDGKSLFVAVAVGRWMLVMRLLLESMQVERWARYILKRTVDRIEVKRVTDSAVVLVTGDGDWLTLDPATLEIVMFREARLSPGWQSDDAIVTRDARWLWRLVEWRQGPKEERRVQIVDTETQRVVRDIGEANVMLPIPGVHEAEVAIVRDYVTSMFLGRGGTVPGYVMREWLSAVVAAPSGEGLVAVYCDEEQDSQLVLIGPTAPGRPVRSTVIANSSGEALHQLAVARDHGLVALRYLVEDANWLETFEEHAGHFRTLWRGILPKQAILVTDGHAHRLWAVANDEGRLSAREVTRDEWSHPYDSAGFRYLGYATFESWDCYADLQEDGAEQGDVPEANTLPNSQSIWRMVEHAQTRDPNELSNARQQYHRYMRQPGGFARASLLRLALEWAFPEDAETILARANRQAQSNDWCSVHRTLNALDTAVLPLGLRQHAVHLLATCAVYAGDVAAARELRQIGAKLDGRCNWSRIDYLTTEDPGRALDAATVADPSQLGESDAAVLALRRALRDAQVSLSAGDPRAAFAAANVPELLLWKDRRLLACATAALLEFQPSDTAERLRREFIIAAFLAADDDAYASSHNIPCAEAWDEGRVAGVRAQAEALFGRELGVAPSRTRKSDTSVETSGDTEAPTSAGPFELAHERLLRHHPGLLPEFDSFISELSDRRNNSIVGGVTEADLLSDARLWPCVEAERERLARHAMTQESATFRIEELGPHLGYLANFTALAQAVHWVADDLNVDRLRSQFRAIAPRLATLSHCHCVVLTQARMLELAERLLERDRRCKIAGERIACVTAYLWIVEADPESDVQTVAVRLLFVPRKDLLPHRVARDLECMKEDDFDTFLASHQLDRMEAALDPIVDAPELAMLLTLVFVTVFGLGQEPIQLHDLGLRERARSKASGSRTAKGPSPSAVALLKVTLSPDELAR